MTPEIHEPRRGTAIRRLPSRQLPPPDERPAVTVDARGVHIVLTCDLSLPPGVIQEMTPLPNGMTLLQTDRGIRRVREPYHKIAAVLAHIGAEVSNV